MVINLNVKEKVKGIYLIVICAFFLFFSGNVSAATIYVNSVLGNDTTGNGTQGVPYKTFHKGYTVSSSGDTINLSGTFTWTDADETGDAANTGYTISKNLTIQGQSASQTIVQAASSDNTADRRIFTITLGNTVTINNLTIRYGKVGSSQDGGGVYINGTANINNCDISYNRAPDGSGGGVDTRGILTIQNSTIHHNIASYMGGGLNRDYYSGSGGAPGASDLMDIINSTVSNNQVTQTVAYLEGAGVFFRRGSGSITNSTISYNSIINGAGTSTHGIGTGDPGVVVRLKNNIIAANTLTNCWSGEIGHREVGGGTYTDNGGNIIGKLGYYRGGFTPAATTWVDQADGCVSPDGTYVLQNGGSTNGTLSLNNSLADNSTLNGTQTFSITSATSIAINNGLTGTNGSISVPSTDQRGANRNGSTDIGAFEYAGVIGTPVVDSLFPADDATGVSTTANLVITFSEAVDAEAGANNDIIIKKASDNSTVETIDAQDAKVSGSGTVSITINPDAVLLGSTAYYVQIGADAFDDADSNSYAGISDTTSWNFTTGDFTAPTITSISSDKTDGSYKAGEVIDIDVTFSEAVTSTGNVTVTLETGDTDRTCTFTVTNSTTGTCNYTVQAGDTSLDLDAAISGTINDQSSNALTSYSPATTLAANKAIVIDTASPTMTITASQGIDGFTSNDATLSLTFTSNETTANFTSGDISVSNGAISDFTATSGTVYTAIFTPTASGAATIDVADSTFTDAAANSNTAADQFNWIYDNISPSVIFSPANSSTGVSAGSDITITFNEAVRNIDNSAVTNTNVDTLITLKDTNASGADIPFDATIDGAKLIITINPTGDFTSEQIVYIAIGSTVEDAYNNAINASSATFTVADISAPVISGASPSGSQSAGIASATLSVTTSENATCKYSATSGAVFALMTAFTTTGTTGHSVSVSGLTDGTSYNYYVKCQDSSNNESAETIISFSIAVGGSAGAPASAPASGSGASNSSIGMNQTASIGVITTGGTNILSYIGSQADFSAITSKNFQKENYNLKIADLDLYKNTIKIYVPSSMQTLSIDLGKTVNVDLDKDNINDIEIKFADIWVNRAELTTRSLIGEKTPDVKTGLKDNIVNLENNSLSDSFVRDLKFGMCGSEVSNLQRYLNAKGFILDTKGAGSPGNETTYFGKLTQNALIKFQEASKNQATEITTERGYLGPITRKLINFSPEVSLRVPQKTDKLEEKNPNSILTTNLSLGMRSEGVKTLQNFLSLMSDIYPEKFITGYFGELTQKAVQRFQIKFGIVNSETDDGYGMVGPRTRAKIKETIDK